MPTVRRSPTASGRTGPRDFALDGSDFGCRYWSVTDPSPNRYSGRLLGLWVCRRDLFVQGDAQARARGQFGIPVLHDPPGGHWAVSR